MVFLKTLSSITNSDASYLAPVILALISTTLPIVGGYFTKILSKKNTSNVESVPDNNNVKSGTDNNNVKSGTDNNNVKSGTDNNTVESGTEMQVVHGSENGEAKAATPNERSPLIP